MDKQDYYEDEIDLVDYFRVIYKYRVMIIVIVLASAFFVGIVSLRKPKIYEATATFFPLNTSSNIETQGMIVKPGLNIEDLIISILESRKMADRIIEQLDLKKIWNQAFMTDARKVLSEASNISLGKNGIIKLSVKTEFPQLSAQVTNAYVDNLDYFNNELEIGAQRKIVQIIDRAVVPEKRMGRGTVKKVILGGIVSFMLAIFSVFFIEFIKNSDFLKQIKE